MKTSIKIYISISVLLIIILILFLLLKKDSENSIEKVNDPEVEKRVNILQSEISSFVFVTQEGENDYRLHLNLTPFLNIDVGENEISEFKISDFEGNCEGGDVVLVSPTDLSTSVVSRTFLFTENSEAIKSKDILSSGNGIEYIVVPEISQFNQVINKGNILPYFTIIVKDIGIVKFKDILERDGNVDGSRYLEYSEIDLSTLDLDLQFNLEILFKDGKTYSKIFKGEFIGNRLKDEVTPVFILE